MKQITLFAIALIFSLVVSAQKIEVPKPDTLLTVATPYLSYNDIEPFWKTISGRVQSQDGTVSLVLTKDEWELLRQIYNQVVNEAAARWKTENKKLNK